MGEGDRPPARDDDALSTAGDRLKHVEPPERDLDKESIKRAVADEKQAGGRQRRRR